MKKYLFMLGLIVLFSVNASSENNDNCKNLKKLSPSYLKCKASILKSTSNNIGLDTDNVKEKKYIIDWFKKK